MTGKRLLETFVKMALNEAPREKRTPTFTYTPPPPRQRADKSPSGWWALMGWSDNARGMVPEKITRASSREEASQKFGRQEDNWTEIDPASEGVVARFHDALRQAQEAIVE